MQRTISNSDDVIDSRDVIARIDELESDLQAQHETEVEAGAQTEDDAEEGKAVVPTEFETWLQDTADDGDHAYNEEASELLILRALAEQCEGYGDWHHGETLIRDSYFERYAEQLAEDTGIDLNQGWPLNCIDWERAARELQMDYTSVDFDGVTYWMRS